ncbi:ester cyclase [Sphingobium sp. JS3065]|uniref:ester cyclase n=1 Tax=Sphingobium sp. JS3065 TaxID=2970925 RepID=UPI002264EFD2|nr:ester cyclase [Sphingobium sp. JS3065]UZW57529.1 ester cyclase [Sphingobium sp. JS3065]
MNEEVARNEALAREYLMEGWGRNQPDILDRILSPTCKRHLHGAVTGGTLAKATLTGFRGAFPDATVEIELLFGKDDLVVCRSITSGTHNGNYLGIPASGRNVRINAVDFFRFCDGRIVESWHNVDEVALRRDLGQEI